MTQQEFSDILDRLPALWPEQRATLRHRLDAVAPEAERAQQRPQADQIALQQR